MREVVESVDVSRNLLREGRVDRDGSVMGWKFYKGEAAQSNTKFCILLQMKLINDIPSSPIFMSSPSTISSDVSSGYTWAEHLIWMEGGEPVESVAKESRWPGLLLAGSLALAALGLGFCLQ